MKFFTSAIAVVALIANAASAYSTAGSITSSFGGSVLVTGKASPSVNVGPSIEMRKGKDNVPPAMRTQYKRQKELSNMREQMMDAQKPGADGLPVFNLFVRTPRANVSVAFQPIDYGYLVIPLIFYSLQLSFSSTDVVPMWII